MEKLEKGTNAWSLVVKISLLLAIFLIPIFIWNWGFVDIEFVKANLAVILVSIGFIAYLGKVLVTGKFGFNKNLLNWGVLGVLAVTLLSAIFCDAQ